MYRAVPACQPDSASRYTQGRSEDVNARGYDSFRGPMQPQLQPHHTGVQVHNFTPPHPASNFNELEWFNFGGNAAVPGPMALSTNSQAWVEFDEDSAAVPEPMAASSNGQPMLASHAYSNAVPGPMLTSSNRLVRLVNSYDAGNLQVLQRMLQPYLGHSAPERFVCSQPRLLPQQSSSTGDIYRHSLAGAIPKSRGSTSTSSFSSASSISRQGLPASGLPHTRAPVPRAAPRRPSASAAPPTAGTTLRPVPNEAEMLRLARQAHKWGDMLRILDAMLPRLFARTPPRPFELEQLFGACSERALAREPSMQPHRTQLLQLLHKPCVLQLLAQPAQFRLLAKAAAFNAKCYKGRLQAKAVYLQLDTPASSSSSASASAAASTASAPAAIPTSTFKFEDVKVAFAKWQRQLATKLLALAIKRVVQGGAAAARAATGGFFGFNLSLILKGAADVGVLSQELVDVLFDCMAMVVQLLGRMSAEGAINFAHALALVRVGHPTDDLNSTVISRATELLNASLQPSPQHQRQQHQHHQQQQQQQQRLSDYQRRLAVQMVYVLSVGQHRSCVHVLESVLQQLSEVWDLILAADDKDAVMSQLAAGDAFLLLLDKVDGLGSILTPEQVQDVRQRRITEQVSRLQENVYSSVQVLAAKHGFKQLQMEALTYDDQRKVDVKGVDAYGRYFAVEIDGLGHTVGLHRPNGPTVLRNDSLEHAGYHLFTVMYNVWEALGNDAAAKQQHLEEMFGFNK